MKAFYKTSLYNEVYTIMDRVNTAPTIYEGICKEIPNALHKAKNAARDFKYNPMRIALALLIIKYENIQIFVGNNTGFKCQFSKVNNYNITNFQSAYKVMYGKYVNLNNGVYIN